MQKKKRLIPFSWNPGSWGLKNKAYDEAEAYYYYEGKDLDLRLAEIKYSDDKKELAKHILGVKLKHREIDDYEFALLSLDLERQERESNDPMSQKEYDLLKLKIEFEYGKITAYECDCKELDIEFSDQETNEYQLAKLAVELKHEKITQHEYDKKVATLKEEPWIGIVDQGFDPDKGIGGVYFEFDWNEYWIIFLRMNGYHGNTEDQIIDQWFADVCRSQNVQPQQWDDGSVIPFNGRIVNRTPDQI